MIEGATLQVYWKGLGFRDSGYRVPVSTDHVE